MPRLRTQNAIIKPIPYLWLDEELGTPVMLGEPCTILFTESLAALNCAVLKLVGTGAGAILREIGKNMGRQFARLTLRQFPQLTEMDIETQINEVACIILRNNGWGRIDFTSIDMENHTFTLNLFQHPSSRFRDENGQIKCHLEAGLISGILEIILNDNKIPVKLSSDYDKKCCVITINNVE